MVKGNIKKYAKWLCYISYKIANNFLFSIEKKKKVSFAAFIGSVPSKAAGVLFDFSHSTTHLGDRLFFFKLIDRLKCGGCNVYLANDDLITNSIYKSLYGSELRYVSDQEVDLVISPKPSYLRVRNINKPLMIIDFNNQTITRKISDELVYVFGMIFPGHMSSEPSLLLTDQLEPAACSIIEDNNSYYILSNYINSGFFRKWFVKEDKLINKCRELRLMGHKIIHVGSSVDKVHDGYKYDCVDIDQRGCLNLFELVEIMKSPQVLGMVGFDNFLMHVCGLLNKTSYVLFRGRFTESASVHHFKYVNNNCFFDEKKLVYL